MRVIRFIFIGALFSALFISSFTVFSATLKLDIKDVFTDSPKQVVKEFTASNYLSMSLDDFDRDGQMETIVGANCVEGFCENYIFKHLNNERYQFLGMAKFRHDSYELVWSQSSSVIFPELLFFRYQNVGQGCLGRYRYNKDEGYRLISEVCRLPRQVGELLGSHTKQQRQAPKVTIKDPDYIDFSDLRYDDQPEDFFPEAENN